jgi:HD superfamily phosphohydrolase
LTAGSNTQKETIIRDPIHDFIDVSHYDFILKIIHTPYFQRTRRLSQLGVSLFVYPSATHSRFNHSLGAMEVFVRLFHHLYKDEMKGKVYHNLRKTGIASVLLHDIGHGPFSHASEGPLGFQHEMMSMEIVKTNEIRGILEDADICVEDVLSVISKTATGKMKLLSQLIGSELDVDRLDYLARDIYFTGVGFGGVDLQRIIKTMTISRSNNFLNGYA